MTKGASALSQAMLQTVTWGGHSGTARRYLLWQLRLLPQPPIWSAHPIQLVAISPGPPSSSFSSLHCHLPPHSPAVTLQKSCQALNNSLNRTGWWTALDFGFQLVAPDPLKHLPPPSSSSSNYPTHTHNDSFTHSYSYAPPEHIFKVTHHLETAVFRTWTPTDPIQQHWGMCMNEGDNLHVHNQANVKAPAKLKSQLFKWCRYFYTFWIVHVFFCYFEIYIKPHFQKSLFKS